KVRKRDDEWHAEHDRWKALPKDQRPKDGPAWNASQRRGVQNKIDEAKARFRRLVREACEEIVQYAFDNRLLICIDNIKCGQEMGTFGQDYGKEFMLEWAQAMRAPHVLADSEFTSERCNQ